MWSHFSYDSVGESEEDGEGLVALATQQTEQIRQNDMTRKEERVVAKLVSHMGNLQRQIAEPSRVHATDAEVVKILSMLWEFTPTPIYKLPEKAVIESLVGLFRGCKPREYCYISRTDVARIIRERATLEKIGYDGMVVELNKGADKMSDIELYINGKWNYKPTSMVEILYNIHVNPTDY